MEQQIAKNSSINLRCQNSKPPSVNLNIFKAHFIIKYSNRDHKIIFGCIIRKKTNVEFGIRPNAPGPTQEVKPFYILFLNSTLHPAKIARALQPFPFYACAS